VLWLPAAAGLGGYALFRAEGRFLPGFIIGLFAAGCAAFDHGTTPVAAKLTRSIAYAITIILTAQAIVQVGHAASTFSVTDFPDWRVASALHELEIVSGDKVSFMGNTLEDHVWAHLARVQISAEIPQEDVQTFWAATGSEKQQALDRLSASGAKALLTRNVPSTAISEGWTKIGETDYYVMQLLDREK